MTPFIVAHIAQSFLMIVLGMCFVAIIIAAYYDAWILRKQKKYVVAFKRMRTKRPHVTVIIDAKSNDALSMRCLTELFKNRYLQFDVVLVTHGTKSDAYTEAVQFKRLHPAAKLRIYAQRKPVSAHLSLQRAYAKSERGAYVIVLRSDHIVPRTFVRDAVTHYASLTLDTKRRAVAFGMESVNDESLLSSLFTAFGTGTHMLRKIFSVLGIGAGSTAVALMYDKTHITKKNASKITRVFDSTLSVRTISTKMNLSAWRFVVMAVTFILAGYSLVTAASGQNTAVLFYGWLIVVAYFGASLWSYDYASSSEKAKLSITVPSLYFFGYVMLAWTSALYFRSRKRPL